MTTRRFFIIEQDPDGFPPPPAVESVPGRGRVPVALRPMGGRGRPARPTAEQPTRVKVATAELSDKEASAERRREGVRMIGRAMPVRLIAYGDREPVPAAMGASWGIAATGADRSPRTGNGVTVAVLDTGINKKHPAFAGMELVCRDFTVDGEVKTAVDRHGHGTHCAGTIFGREIDGTRIGVAPGIERALIGKVLPDDGGGDSGMLFDALTWASREGANIVSMSLGFDFPGLVATLTQDGMAPEVAASNALVVFGQNLRAFDTLMANFRVSEFIGRNMLVVSAAGNESRRDQAADFRISTSLPAATLGVVSVAAYGQNGGGFRIAPFSNIDALIAGPGVDIVSADLKKGLARMSGTSQACPHVAGLAALWWEAIAAGGETPTPDRVREKLFSAAVTDGLPADCDETERGRGRALAPLG
ncbi:subtilisin family serine protease [Sphingobium sp. OAS761]|uniref:S8 family peptidase n=1 Tax=Sphingobium sp. OAS761 TaxID=2817901 RepID=UPI00209FBD2D|nr:S8 family serine peptidase [Sphingobium sp. OAS761]MCP1469024.1 subtilisin family serine protease [Sphingobium sp. OAS761]